MTDTSQAKQTTANTASSMSIDILLRQISNNVTPPMVGYFVAHFPLMGESVWFQLVVFALSTAGAAITNCTKYSIWDNIRALILWVRRGLKQVSSAKDEPLN